MVKKAKPLVSCCVTLNTSGPGCELGMVAVLLAARAASSEERPRTLELIEAALFARLLSITAAEPLLPWLMLNDRPFTWYCTAPSLATVLLLPTTTLPALTFRVPPAFTLPATSRLASSGLKLLWFRWMPKFAELPPVRLPPTNVLYSTSELVLRSPRVMTLYCDIQPNPGETGHEPLSSVGVVVGGRAVAVAVGGTAVAVAVAGTAVAVGRAVLVGAVEVPPQTWVL
ncbi:hypothetical protein F8S13_24810 [Chloroflexia bacterium SDU3-3]|nr:hypothetical protein F8S13_24810 [Chloroflexia bacterium SDU3-3]